MRCPRVRNSGHSTLDAQTLTNPARGPGQASSTRVLADRATLGLLLEITAGCASGVEEAAMAISQRHAGSGMPVPHEVPAPRYLEPSWRGPDADQHAENPHLGL